MSNIDEKIIFEPTGFEYQNTKAKVVIVGITPGNSQLKGDREGLDLREIKRKNAFAGSMRPNLVNMLDYTGVNKKDGSKMMFKDVKKIAKSEKLTTMLENGFVKDCTKYEHQVLFVACGPGVYNTLKELQAKGKIEGDVIGIAHPSGANLGRVLCYQGKAEPKGDSYVWCQERAKEAKAFCISQTSPK